MRDSASEHWMFIVNIIAQVGIETAEKSRGVDVPLNECHELEEE
jgi:hypothetical protein